MEILDNNNKDDFDVDIRHSLDFCFNFPLLAHTLAYIFEVTLGVQCISHQGYLKEIFWYETNVHFSYDNEKKTPMIY